MIVTKEDVIRQLLEDICYCSHRHEVQHWNDCPGTPEERLKTILKHAREGLAVLSGKLKPQKDEHRHSCNEEAGVYSRPPRTEDEG